MERSVEEYARMMEPDGQMPAGTSGRWARQETDSEVVEPKRPAKITPVQISNTRVEVDK